jgi:UDP-N-acetylmuramyl tripeptide synthase
MNATRIGPRTALALRAGRFAGALSRRAGLGAGGTIGGRLALALDGGALARLADGRRVVLVTGTNGKTTTAHLLAAALRTAGPVAHNDGGANMTDGVASALLTSPRAPVAVLEVDELHLGEVAEATRPAVVVLLNLSRDQLDRGPEVRAVARELAAALDRTPGTRVVANADDPAVVHAARSADRPVWVSVGAQWRADEGTCPACGAPLEVRTADWRCGCGLRRPAPDWELVEGGVRHPGGVTPLRLSLPGSFNLGNAAFVLAAASLTGVPPASAAAAVEGLTDLAGRYAVVRRGPHTLHLLLAKNPAGWAAALPLMAGARSLLLAVNAREADGRDTSWLWDVPFEELPARPVVAAGERAADLGLRLDYAEWEHDTEPDPLAALDLLPPGDVHVVANYSAFRSLLRRLSAEERG